MIQRITLRNNWNPQCWICSRRMKWMRAWRTILSKWYDMYQEKYKGDLTDHSTHYAQAENQFEINKVVNRCSSITGN